MSPLTCPLAAVKTASLPAVSNNSGCVKCGTTKKSGKRSCCAPGGAWYKNCGDAGDMKFDHTWAEGIQACNGFTTSVSVESSPRGMLLRRVRAVENTRSTVRSQNATHKQIFVYRAVSTSNDGITDYENTSSVVLAKATVFICILSIISLLQK